MAQQIDRREFLQISAGAGAFYLAGASRFARAGQGPGPGLVSPGCRSSKVKVARLYMGTSHGLWP